MYSQRSAIGEGFHNIGDLAWAWVAAASLVEVLSMLALALLYRALLQASQARLTVAWILASSYTANAISIAVPVIGSGMASRQAYRQFREGGADPAAASLTLTLAGIVSTVTLATVVAAAAVLSGNPAASAGGLLAAVAMLAAAVAVAVELRSEKGRARLRRLIAISLRCSQRVIHRPKGEAQTLAQAVVASASVMAVIAALRSMSRLGSQDTRQASPASKWWSSAVCGVASLRMILSVIARAMSCWPCAHDW